MDVCCRIIQLLLVQTDQGRRPQSATHIATPGLLGHSWGFHQAACEADGERIQRGKVQGEVGAECQRGCKLSSCKEDQWPTHRCEGWSRVTVVLCFDVEGQGPRGERGAQEEAACCGIQLRSSPDCSLSLHLPPENLEQLMLGLGLGAFCSPVFHRVSQLSCSLFPNPVTGTLITLITA